MRVSLRDRDGHEIDAATAADPKAAVYEGASMLTRRSGLYVGDTLTIDDDAVLPAAPDTRVTVSAASLGGLAGRLERGTGLTGADLKTAARFIRHALRVAWVGKTSVAI